VAIAQFQPASKRPELHLGPLCGGSPFNTGEMVNSPRGAKDPAGLAIQPIGATLCRPASRAHSCDDAPSWFVETEGD